MGLKQTELKKRFEDFKRPTVQLLPEEHKKILHYCVDHDLKIGEFLKRAALYCVKNKIDLK